MAPGAFPLGEIRRDAILRRLDAAQARLMLIAAPAGYGKSTVIRQYAHAFGSSAVCDCLDVPTAAALAQRISAALAEGDAQRMALLGEQRLAASPDGAEWLPFALESWSQPSVNDLFIFENTEHASRFPETAAFLSRALARAPRGRRIAICTRIMPQLTLHRSFAPHEIITLRASDLKFDEHEIAQVFFGNDELAKYLAQTSELTRGWPIAVFLLARLAREGLFPQLMSRLNAINFEDLYSYLATQVLESTPAKHLEYLLAFAAIPSATGAEVARALEAPHAPEELAGLAVESPFFYALGADRYEVHPLVCVTLIKQHHERCTELLLACARASESQDLLRAAQLYMVAGDQQSAADCLERNALGFLMSDLPVIAADIIQRLDRDILLCHPALWAESISVRVGLIPHQQWLQEALLVREQLTAATPAAVWIGVLANLANVLTNLGRHDDALAITHEITDRYPHVALATALARAMDSLVYARTGKFQQAMQAVEEALESAPGQILSPLLILQVEALVLRYRGNRAYERIRLDAGIAMATDLRLRVVVALLLEEAAFGAWFAGEDSLFSSYLKQLERATSAVSARATAVFLGSAGGNAEPLLESVGIEHPKIRCYAALMSCVTASAESRKGLAELAYRSALDAGEPMNAAIAAIVCAECDPSNAAALIKRAREHCLGVESDALSAAIEAYAASGPDAGILEPLLRRLRRHLGDSGPAKGPAILVSLARGRVERDGSTVPLSPRELELAMYLATRKHPCPGKDIVEVLWPDREQGGYSAARFYVMRLRTKIGKGAIIASRGGYTLANDVLVDLRDIERRVAAARRSKHLAGEAQNLRAILHDLLPRKWAHPRWEWYAPIEAHMHDLAREIATILGHAALKRDDLEDALALADRIVDLDPCDEPARALRIRVLLARGDYAFAQRELRDYQRVLAAELGAEPSPEIFALFGADTRRVGDLGDRAGL